jgi:hypothetical protein
MAGHELVTEGFALAPDPREVAAVFEVPLAFLCDPANRRLPVYGDERVAKYLLSTRYVQRNFDRFLSNDYSLGSHRC